MLLVDDHPINRRVASLFLCPFSMHMPVMDGPTCIGAIRASSEPWAAIPVIALTADAMSGNRERYLAMGMNGYLSKPLAERDLLSEIARVSLPTTSATSLPPLQPG